MPEKRSAFGRALGLFDWEMGSPSSAFGSLALSPPSPGSLSPRASNNTLNSSLSPKASNNTLNSPLSPKASSNTLRSPLASTTTLAGSPPPRSATFPPPTPPTRPPPTYHNPTKPGSSPPRSGQPAHRPSAATHTTLPAVPEPPSTSPRSYPSSLSIPPMSPKESRFAVPNPPSMSPGSYPSSLSSEAPLTPPDRQVTFAETPAPNRPASFKSTTSSGKKASIGRVNNLFSNSPRSHAPIPVAAIAKPAPPLPSYESIQVVAHRPEDIAAVRSSLAQLQLTWSLYRELGRPSNLADALERQLASVVSNVDRLADLPPFTITVPTQRRD